jgi:signal transduction protein with GAF and PtsI domain
MYNLDKIYELNNQLPLLFEQNFKRNVLLVTTAIENKSLVEDIGDINKLFFIEKVNDENLFSIAENTKDFDSKVEKFKDELDKFKIDFVTFLERVDSNLNKQTREALLIINKTIENRKKKLFFAIDSFQIQDNWNMTKIRDEYLLIIEKSFSNIIDEIVRTISTGINSLNEKHIYRELLNIFNRFLKSIGIYTILIAKGEKVDEAKWKLIDPQNCGECSTNDKNLKDIIKEVLSLPYMVDDNRAVLNGKAFFWSVK